ncbi:MAG: TIGR02452 family protein, partial [Gammaproteobacteria bacterium]|nr:TIGR02452 family protein [Gammaproteobacteria bacterium]
ARQQAAAALAALRPRGQTNLGEAWLTACGLIGHNGGAERLRRCLVLTDGQANVGITAPATLADHAAHLLQLGVRTSTFGVGDDYHEELLGQLADAGGGTCHDIAGAEGIPIALGRELGDALEMVYADVRVHLTWQADLQVRALGTWRTQTGPRSLTLLPGDLVSEQVLDLLVEVRFPAGPQDRDCPLQIQVNEGDQPLAADVFRWTWVDSARRKAQPREVAVERQVAALLAHQARREAAARNRDGDLAGARERLRHTAAELRHYRGEDAEVRALAVSLETEVENHRVHLSPRDIKQRIYQSASALKGRQLDGGRARREELTERQTWSDRLHCLPPQDRPDPNAAGQPVPKLSRDQCAALAKATMTALLNGTYANAAGQPVDWQDAVEQAIATKRSLPPDAPLPGPGLGAQGLTRVQVTSESTLVAARRLRARHPRVLVLVFGNGIEPGGGFLLGNRGQESALCRASALYATLQGDALYAAHQARPQPDATNWAILSPDVPVFRDDAGQPLDQPWSLSFITAAAPYAPRLGREPAARLMQSRIRRVLAIARAYGYPALVLGAWGCGTYGNDPARIAALFRSALEAQAGAFAEVVFAVADGSPGRKTYEAFSAAFNGQS